MIANLKMHAAFYSILQAFWPQLQRAYCIREHAGPTSIINFSWFGFSPLFPALHAKNMHLCSPSIARNSLSRPACKRNYTIINLKERGVKLFIKVKKGGRSRRSSQEEKRVTTWVNVRVWKATKVSINTFGAHSHPQSPQSWPQGLKKMSRLTLPWLDVCICCM